MVEGGRKPVWANYSIANYLKTNSKFLDTLIENVVKHSKIVATEIIDDILKGAVKTDNNSTKPKLLSRYSIFAMHRMHISCFQGYYNQQCVGT
jgi:hypothetical protein